MQKRVLNLFTFFVISIFVVTGIFAQGGFNYPKAKKVNQVDNYHGRPLPILIDGLRMIIRLKRSSGLTRKTNLQQVI